MAATQNGNLRVCGSDCATDGACHKQDRGISDRVCDNLASSFGGTAQVADSVRDELSESLKQNIIRSRCRSKQSQHEARLAWCCLSISFRRWCLMYCCQIPKA